MTPGLGTGLGTEDVATEHHGYVATRRARQAKPSAHHRDDRPARPRRRVWPWVLLGVALLLVAIGVVVAVAAVHLADRATTVRDELTAAKNVAATIPKLASARDTAGLEAASAQLSGHTDAALAATADPLWSFVEQVPMVGANLSAVRKTATAADILVAQAMPPAVRLLSDVSIDRFAIKDGRIDLAALQAALPVIPDLRDAVAAAQAQVADIDRTQLVPQVDQAIGQLLDVLDDAAPLLNEAQRVLPVALNMLGQAEPRNYLLMFQNNAEVRATGGNPASLALLHVENGAISLPEQSGSQNLANWRGASLDFGFPPEMLQLYESDFVPNMQNYTRTPDFPTSARMMIGIWQQEIGGEIDGVVSIDPVALQFLLAATGPVTLSDGVQIDSGNAAQVLLGETYERYDNGRVLDAYFADAAQRVFAKLTSGDGSPQAMLDAIVQGVDAHRVLVWMARPDEEALAAEYGATGTFVPDNTDKTQVGIFVNDSGYSKLEYWLTSSVSMTADLCSTGDGPATITTSITLTSSAPSSGLSVLQGNLRGARLGVSASTMILDVLFFGPVGGQITAVDPEGGDWSRLNRTGVEQSRPAETVTIGLQPGETRTVTYTSTVDRASIGASTVADVRTTPLVGDTPITIQQKPCG